jgi:hypothetical protein
MAVRKLRLTFIQLIAKKELNNYKKDEFEKPKKKKADKELLAKLENIDMN